MTAESLLWMLAQWAVRAAALAGATGLLLWLLRIKDVSLRLTIWTGVLLGALAMPVISIWAPPLSLSMHRVTPRATAITTLPDMNQDVLRSRSAAPRHDWFTWPNFLIAVWSIGAAAMVLRLGVGFLAGRRVLVWSRLVEPGIRESCEVTVPVTVGMLHPVVLLPADWRQWDPKKLKMVLAHELAHVRRRDPLRRMAASVYRALCWFHPLAWWLWTQLAELAEAASDDAALASVQNHALYAETLLEFFRLMPRRVKWEGVAMSSPKKVTSRIERVLDVRRRLSGVVSARAFAGVALTALPLVYLAASTTPTWADPAPLAVNSQNQPAATQTAVPQQAVDPASLNTAALRQPAAPPAVRKRIPSASAAQNSSPAVAATVDARCGGKKIYSQWINEDVLYIISSAERTAFENLKEVSECDAFIDQFWDRRNPNPGSTQNAFKAEHYRRIAYANVHFGSPGKPGWQTDRGRIYITYGPPDDIQKFSTAGPGSPKEAWVYPQISVGGVPAKLTVEFIDEPAAGGEPIHIVIDLENPK